MPVNLSDEERQRRYFRARNELDQTFSIFNGKISPHIEEIIDYKAYSLLALIREWANLYHNNIRRFDEVVDFTDTRKKIGKALSQYTKYVYNYRFCNNLANNILFRKILSFEMYFLSKNNVLGRKIIIKPEKDQTSDNNEVLLYLSPLAHFMFYRIQKELHLRTYNLAQAHVTTQLFDEILTIIRMNLHEFFSNYQSNDCKIHSQDDFRKFLDRSENQNLSSIIEFIEKNLKINI